MLRIVSVSIALAAAEIALPVGGIGAETGPQTAAQVLQARTAGFVPGDYTAHWEDGRELVDTILILSPDLITLQRQGSSGAPQTFQRIDAGLFRNSAGATLTVLTPTELVWADATGEISVLYSLR